MFQKVTKKLFGSRNQRLINQYGKAVKKINDLEESYKALDEQALKNKTLELRDQISNGVSLEEILPDAFATVREAAFRVLNMRHFDVQLIGGMVLNNGNIAEMRTGEGKTLVARACCHRE